MLTFGNRLIKYFPTTNKHIEYKIPPSKKTSIDYSYSFFIDEYKDKIVIPEDVVISDGVSVKNIDSAEGVPEGWMALDIGPKTQREFSDLILQSKTVFLAGPMGKFEDEKFILGSRAIFDAMKNITKNQGGTTIVAGGDTIDVAGRCGDLSDYSHISLAGGATLEFLAGKELPALKALTE